MDVSIISFKMQTYKHAFSERYSPDNIHYQLPLKVSKMMKTISTILDKNIFFAIIFLCLAGYDPSPQWICSDQNYDIIVTETLH